MLRYNRTVIRGTAGGKNRSAFPHCIAPILADACPERTVKEEQTRRNILTYCKANLTIKTDRRPVESFQMLRVPPDFVILCFHALHREDVSSLSHIAKICPIGIKFYLFESSSPLYFIFLVYLSVAYKTVAEGQVLRVFLDSAT